MRRTVEWHVRKIRETETGGQPTPYDEPMRLMMNQTQTGFYTFSGKKLFESIFDQMKGKEQYLDFDTENMLI